MIPHPTSSIAACLTVALTLGVAAPAGAPEPSRIRLATLGGMSGPVYYSIAEGRFHAIVPVAERGGLGASEPVVR